MLSESAAVSLPADVKEVLNIMDVWREAVSTNHVDVFVHSGWIEWPIGSLGQYFGRPSNLEKSQTLYLPFERLNEAHVIPPVALLQRIRPRLQSQCAAVTQK